MVGEEKLSLKNGINYYIKLAVDFFHSENLLLPNPKVKLKLISASLIFTYPSKFCTFTYFT